MIPKLKLPKKITTIAATLALLLVSVVAPSGASAATLNSEEKALVRSIAKTSPEIAKVVRAALTREDASYRPGGNGPHAFDCSGLVQWSWKKAGVNLKHGTSNQIKQVKRISKKDLKPGDLVFSGRANGGIQHVALYIGDGKVIHATYGSTSRKNQVRIDKLNSSWVMDHKAYGRVKY
jgi:cell wall-associated NlpC family hydrolase